MSLRHLHTSLLTGRWSTGTALQRGKTLAPFSSPPFLAPLHTLVLPSPSSSFPPREINLFNNYKPPPSPLFSAILCVSPVRSLYPPLFRFELVPTQRTPASRLTIRPLVFQLRRLYSFSTLAGICCVVCFFGTLTHRLSFIFSHSQDILDNSRLSTHNNNRPVTLIDLTRSHDRLQ